MPSSFNILTDSPTLLYPNGGEIFSKADTYWNMQGGLFKNILSIIASGSCIALSAIPYGAAIGIFLTGLLSMITIYLGVVFGPGFLLGSLSFMLGRKIINIANS